MELKSKLKNPLIQQYALEIALPLVGYLLFDWSIAVIIAFYFMDYFASEIARHRRHHKIMKHWNGESILFYGGIAVSVILFATAFASSMLVLVKTSTVEVNHIEQIKDFVFSEGWFLLPVVYLAAYIKDVMSFYAPRRYAKYNFQKTIKFSVVENSIMVLLIVVGVLLWAKLGIPEIPALLMFIAIKLCFDQILVRKLNKLAQKF